MTFHRASHRLRRPVRVARALLVLSFVTSACRRSTAPSGEERGALRCLESAPQDPPTRLGPLRLRAEQRALRLDRPPARRGSPWRIVLASGPAPGTRLDETLLARIASRRPDLLVVLGDAGDSIEHARNTVAALGRVAGAVLLLPGGRDDPSVLAEAIRHAGAERTLLLMGWRRLRLGDALQWTLLPGAPEGHFPLSTPHCVLPPALLTETPPPPAPAASPPHRLLAWAAPPTLGISAAKASRPSDPTERCGGEAAWPRSAGHRRRTQDGCTWTMVPSLGIARRRTPEGALAEPAAWLLTVDTQNSRYERIARREETETR